MKVAVTGGTGFVGSVLVEELLSRGHVVSVLSRGVVDVKFDLDQRPRTKDQRVKHHENRESATYMKGNVITGEGLDELMEGKDALIHLVGIIREKGDNTFEAAHHRAVVKVLEAAGRNNIDRVLHMSALGTRAGAVSNYHKTKWKGEEAVRASGVTWTIFRPSIIFGPRDEFVNMLAKAMKKTPVFPVIGEGRNLMQPVSVKDVARAYGDALVEERAIGKVIELGGPDILTFMDIIKKIAQTLDIKRKYVNIPVSLIRPFVRLSDALRVPAPISTDQLIMLGEDNIVMDTSGMELLGFKFMKFADGVREYL
ncbi:MAG: complex I NDUFA9 subunit family protein [bacterium]